MTIREQTTDDLYTLQRTVAAEINLREQPRLALEALASGIDAQQKINPRPKQWAFPVSPLDSYMQGETTEMGGRTWRSTHDFNSGEPGVSGWRMLPHAGDPPTPYLQPSGDHDAYQEGETVTWTDGKIYSASREGVTRSPEDSSSDWALLGSL